jgi:phosphoenolpyruvate carboxykinase (GTP)
MLSPALEGWKIECVGDDIAWMRFGSDGRLYAINPENGFFGVAPGTSMKSNPNAMKTIEKNTIFTNVGLTSEGDVWWEGMSEPPEEGMISWKKEPWSKKLAEEKKETASHANARFTVSARQCPIVSQEFDNPNGVPISAIIFGGRRAFLEPLVYESFDWNHGTFLGATLSSEMTAAAKGVIGQLRNDPFAMLPFCGYNMGDYFAHWIKMGENRDHLPKIFHVNWFKKDQQGKFIWPGFGDNVRVLKWIFSRVKGRVSAEKTAIGLFPKKEDLDLVGLNLAQEELDQLLTVDPQQWLEEVGRIKSYFAKFGEHLPNELNEELKQLSERLSDVNAVSSTKGS